MWRSLSAAAWLMPLACFPDWANIECGVDGDCGSGESCASGLCQKLSAKEPGDSSGSCTQEPCNCGSSPACPLGTRCALNQCIPNASCPQGTPHGCGLRFLAGGTFNMGTACEVPDSVSCQPNTEVRAFWLDAYEVTVGRFRHFVEAGLPLPPGSVPYPSGPLATGLTRGSVSAPEMNQSCPYTSERGTQENHPVACVNWMTALAFCVFQGGRLPTEAEWEWAARGRTVDGESLNTGRTFPWGDALPEGAEFGQTGCDRAQFNRCPSGSPLPTRIVGSFAATGGIYDLAGNVFEWVADAFSDFGSVCWRGEGGLVNPLCQQGDDVALRTIRGGGWASLGADRIQATARLPQSTATDATGFRCAYDIRPPGS